MNYIRACVTLHCVTYCWKSGFIKLFMALCHLTWCHSSPVSPMCQPGVRSDQRLLSSSPCHHTSCLQSQQDRKKGKEEYLYSAFIQHFVSMRSWITQFYLQITPCLPFFRKCSPDGASTKCDGEHLIAAHYSFINLERMKG